MAALTVGVNSWVTLAEADDYKSEEFDSGSWTTLTNTQKGQALITSFRWITRRTNISPAATADHIKYAQIELADYVADYHTEHLKRRALYAQGVRNFKISKWSEKLEASDLPENVKDLLEDELGLGGDFATFSREIENNG
jgi:hypothetical protein